MTLVLDRPAVSLAELNASAALLSRVDRKYVLTAPDADAFVAALPAGARVLEIDGRRSFRYASTYFDTDHLDSFLAAAHRRQRRGKVRARTYLDSGLGFLEVKTRRGRVTVKTRLPWRGATLDAEASAFVAESLGAGGVRLDDRLRPVLDVDYRRTTVLLADAGVRVTLDSALEWRLAGQERTWLLPEAVVVETKSCSGTSRADRLLWRLGHRPASVSKYATGLAALCPDLPRNRWHRLLASGAFSPR